MSKSVPSKVTDLSHGYDFSEGWRAGLDEEALVATLQSLRRKPDRQTTEKILTSPAAHGAGRPGSTGR